MIPILTLALGLAAAPGAAASGAPGTEDGWIRRQVGACILEARPEQELLLEALAERAADLLPRVERELGVRAAAPYRIILLPRDPVGDAVIRDLDGYAPGWAAGYLFPARRIGAIRISRADRYPYSDLASVLAHEATHMLLFDAAGGRLPRWFGEGVATGIERSWGLRDILVYSSSLLTGPLPRLDELDDAFDSSGARARTAYAASFDFLMWTVRTYGQEVVRDIVREAATRPFPEAWRAATGVPLDRAEASWRRGSIILYRWVPAITGTTPLWIGITLLTILAIARRRARTRKILERWESEGDFGDDRWERVRNDLDEVRAGLESLREDEDRAGRGGRDRDDEEPTVH